MSAGPTFREVAAVLLRQHLLERYPSLDIDPNISMVGTPVRALVGNEIVTRPTHYQALTDILARQAVTAVPALYIEGEHFLTQQPINEPAVHLPVRMVDIASLLNLLAPVMLRGYQAQQVEYWNRSDSGAGPNWHKLSGVLRNLWNVPQAPGWSEVDCAMARQLFRAPELSTRRLKDSFGTHAYLLDIDRVDEHGKVWPFNDHLVSVLIGQQQGRQVILAHSLLQGYERYDSLEQLGQALPTFVDVMPQQHTLQWRLREPGGSFFDQMACTLIAIQIQAIGDLDFSVYRNDDASHAALAAPPQATVAGTGPDLEWYRHALPDWLSNASAWDMNAYSRHLKDLATLHSLNAGKTYQDGIAPIGQYALDQLRAEMLKEHPDAAHLPLDKIEIRVRRPVIWGTFAVPGQVDITLLSLAQLALENLIALPLGDKSLRLTNGQRPPEWLSVDYLETLITRIDVGSAYPALVKHCLLDDPKELARREQLYADHLRIQLPLLALQGKIRAQAGLDEWGYRYVVAVLATLPAQRQVDGHTIVMRPLAFAPTRRTDGTQDEVANMFVIGPQDPAAGPCLLYRPLLDQPLTQYPSPTNLIYAIQQHASLRDSVLAWLPDAVREDYSHYVFPGALPSPWAVTEFLVDPTKLWIMSGPLALGEQALNGELSTTLYKANADALVTLADRQSVSNVEARWATFKHTGWLIFNAVLPFLGRTLGVAAWIWQIMDQLQQVVDAQAHPDQQSPWSALADLLLNLGMAIALHGIARNSPAREEGPAIIGKPQVTSLEPVTVKISQLPDLTADDPPFERTEGLHISGAVNSPPRLGVVLDGFKVPRPEPLGAPIDTPGPYQHLYRSGERYYAVVGQRWFEVQVDEDGMVMIIDPTRPGRTGPALVSNRKGFWFIDTRLRLLGGGPKRLVRKAQSLAQRRAEQLRTQLSDFETEKKQAQQALQRTREAMDAGPSSAAPALRQTYLNTLASQCAKYETALQQLKELNIYAPEPTYAQRALGYLKAQTELTSAGIREALITFTPKLRAVLSKIERQAEAPQERYIEEAHEMSGLNLDMLQRLEYMQSRFNELRKLAQDGLRLVRTTQASLPAYTRDDLKALQVTMSRNLCLPAETLTTLPEAWLALDPIVDTADISIQCLRDTLLEGGENRLDERIETLSSLIEQFQSLDERLQDFPALCNEQADPHQLEAVRAHVQEFAQRAKSNLGLLSAERSILRTRSTPPPSPPRPHRQFIRTRYSGLLVGEPRLSSTGEETGLVDILSPLTHKVVATFHEKPPGVWVERLKTPPATPAPVDLAASLTEGQALLDDLPAFLQRAEGLAARADRTPIGIEYLYHQHANRLEQVISAIDSALTQSNATESTSGSANTLNKALSDAVEKLYRQGNTHMARLLKQHPPTIAAVEWLKRHNAISIKKTVSRRPLKAAKPEYLDEYTVIERETHQPLWYAHFRYSTTWGPAKAYLSARLKTVAEQRQGVTADKPKGLSDEQKIAFYRSEISQEQARQLFFGQRESLSS